MTASPASPVQIPRSARLVPSKRGAGSAYPSAKGYPKLCNSAGFGEVEREMSEPEVALERLPWNPSGCSALQAWFGHAFDWGEVGKAYGEDGTVGVGCMREYVSTVDGLIVDDQGVWLM